MTGTNLQGTNIISMIVPTNHADTYATHDSIYGKGGWREVNTLAERDAIPVERRRRGMVVFVRETLKSYQLKNSDTNGGWVPFPGNEDVSEIINSALAEGKISIDLTDYVTKSVFAETMLEYYNKEQTDTLLDTLKTSLTDWVNEQGYLTEHQSLDEYIKKDDLSNILENYVLKTDLDNIVSNLISKSEVDEKLTEYAKLELLEPLATKEELNAFSEYINNEINLVKVKNLEFEDELKNVNSTLDILSSDVNVLKTSNFVTQDSLDARGYLNAENATELISSMGYVDNESLSKTLLTFVSKEELNEELETYTTKDDLAQTLKNGEYLTVKDLQGYATELWVHDYLIKNNYTSIKDLQGYATELWVQDYVAAITGGGEVDLSSYQKKEDFSLETTSKTVVGAINELNSRQVVVDAYTKPETDEKFASKDFVSEKLDDIIIPTKVSELENDAGYLTEHQDISDLATKVEVEAVDAKVNALEIPSIEGLATEDALNDVAETAQTAISAVDNKVDELDEKAVKYNNFTYTNSEGDTATRKTIQLANYDTISGIGTDGTGYNLAMVSKWNVADFGSTGIHMNLNTSDVVTINDDLVVATTNDINEAIKNIPAVDAYTKAEIDTKVSELATKEEVKDNVKYQNFTYTNSEGDTQTRKTIQLDNYDSISGVSTKGTGHNLVMLSKWDVADFGASGVHMNLNTLDTVTINDNKVVATIDDINEAVSSIDTSSYVSKAEFEEKCAEIETLKAQVTSLQSTVQKMLDVIPDTSYLIIGEDNTN